MAQGMPELDHATLEARVREIFNEQLAKEPADIEIGALSVEGGAHHLQHHTARRRGVSLPAAPAKGTP
jgi:hypothetical protein